MKKTENPDYKKKAVPAVPSSYPVDFTMNFSGTGVSQMGRGCPAGTEGGTGVSARQVIDFNAIGTEGRVGHIWFAIVAKFADEVAAVSGKTSGRSVWNGENL